MKSFAKVNLILNLGAKEPSGRYETDFVMQEIDLCDSVEIDDDDGIVIECSDPSVPTDERNLCYKAVKIMRKISGSNRGARISIRKGIPAAGGLGGGSSNAALVARELNEKWKVGLSDDELIRELNPILGTDTSFFVKGGTAQVRKNGREVRSVATSQKLNYVFVLPDLVLPSAKTEDVYKYFDLGRVTQKPDVPGMIQALEKGLVEDVARHLFNAFEFSLPPYYQVIPKIKGELREAGCFNAMMCGAGPTVFGLCHDRTHAEKMAEKLKGRYPLVFIAESVIR